ncbi:MAG TPA: CDP-alcohol phosphatidyltransferase family protein [Candidatus Binatia bacterium]|nr:CDP-alcohol phosphatidyltransferase family protein [Candidatus Binatia bacterium]
MTARSSERPLLLDPLGGLYRYPVARRLLPAALRAGVGPDRVTIARAVVGVAAAALVPAGDRAALVVAFALAELAMVLDCLDGLVARTLGRVSERGRALDELADGVSFAALSVAIAFRLGTRAPDFPAATSAVALFAIAGLCAWAYEGYRGALTSGGEPRARAAPDGDGRGTGWPAPATRSDALVRLSRGFDRAQRILFFPRSSGRPPRHPRLALLAVGLLGAENLLTILHLGILADRLPAAQVVALAYGLAVLPVGVAAGRRLVAARSYAGAARSRDGHASA